MLEYVIWFFLIDWVASSPIRLTYRNNGNHARRLVVFGDSLSDDGRKLQLLI
jgi:phospholipase/lecithinase/hemolysin